MRLVRLAARTGPSHRVSVRSGRGRRVASHDPPLSTLAVARSGDFSAVRCGCGFTACGDSAMSDLFLPVPGWPEYEANCFGCVRRAVSSRVYGIGRQLKPWICKGNGYWYVTLHRPGARKNFQLHRLIALLFIPGRSVRRCEVAHVNGIRSDLNLENLRWSTPVENQADRLHTKTHAVGEANPAAKYTRAEINRIRQLRSEGYSRHEVADAVGIPYKYVCEILKGRRWAKCAPDEKEVRELREARHGNARA